MCLFIILNELPPSINGLNCCTILIQSQDKQIEIKGIKTSRKLSYVHYRSTKKTKLFVAKNFSAVVVSPKVKTTLGSILDLVGYSNKA